MIYIRRCQESNSQPVPSQVHADSTRPEWQIICITLHTIPTKCFLFYQTCMIEAELKRTLQVWQTNRTECHINSLFWVWKISFLGFPLRKVTLHFCSLICFCTNDQPWYLWSALIFMISLGIYDQHWYLWSALVFMISLGIYDQPWYLWSALVFMISLGIYDQPWYLWSALIFMISSDNMSGYMTSH